MTLINRSSKALVLHLTLISFIIITSVLVDGRRSQHQHNKMQHSKQLKLLSIIKGDGTKFSLRALPIRTNVPLKSKLKNWITLISSTSTSTTSPMAMETTNKTQKPNEYNPIKMYLTCIWITLIWVASGTLFYSVCNEWPISQSFFYSIDAGMSIGFCTDVVETKLLSKAFTIIYILFGASIVGGALALFIQNAIVQDLSSPKTKEYQFFLEKKVFESANASHTGALNFSEFRSLILSSVKHQMLSEEEILILWKKFDRLKDGVIHFEEFVGTFRSIDQLVKSLKNQQNDKNRLRLLGLQVKTKLQQAWQIEYRVYFCWLAWILVGIAWGTMTQKWDIITATHFAISALATGGLTAPQVNQEGILPPGPSIFCGIYCLIGIPLFGLTLSSFARILVQNHVTAMEAKALTRPMSPTEYDIARHLTTPKDSVVHLSDFIVMQLLRQGRISPEIVQVLQSNFDLLDYDHTGTLTLHQATDFLSSK